MQSNVAKVGLDLVDGTHVCGIPLSLAGIGIELHDGLDNPHGHGNCAKLAFDPSKRFKIIKHMYVQYILIF